MMKIRKSLKRQMAIRFHLTRQTNLDAIDVMFEKRNGWHLAGLSQIQMENTVAHLPLIWYERQLQTEPNGTTIWYIYLWKSSRILYACLKNLEI